MKTKNRTQGFSLIELMIVVALFALLVVMAAPSIQVYLENTKLRDVAESIAAGMQKARAHAVQRNVLTDFVINTATKTWTINELNTATTPPTPTAVETFTWGAGGNNWASITVPNVTPGGATTITFDGMGRVVSSNPIGAANPLQTLQVNGATYTGVYPLTVQTGFTGTGTLRRGIRVCDPRFNETDDPKACSRPGNV